MAAEIGRFTAAGRAAIDAHNLYAGLVLALTLPDICGELEQLGSNHYTKWSTRWITPRFTQPSLDGSEPLRLSGADCYKLRNKLFHEGTAQIYSKADGQPLEFEFCDETYASHFNHVNSRVHLPGRTETRRFFQLKVDLFCKAVFDAVDAWSVSVRNDPKVHAAAAKLLYIKTASDPPDSLFHVRITAGARVSEGKSKPAEPSPNLFLTYQWRI